MGITEKAVLYSHFCFSWELSEIVAAKPDGARLLREAPAAFGRLCVETGLIDSDYQGELPAAFGRLCVETRAAFFIHKIMYPAAFGRLCVETGVGKGIQTPVAQPAAFGRLCVETASANASPSPALCSQPPSGGCVLKPRPSLNCSPVQNQPPSGGCVLKQKPSCCRWCRCGSSRLRAAVC